MPFNLCVGCAQFALSILFENTGTHKLNGLCYKANTRSIDICSNFGAPNNKINDSKLPCTVNEVNVSERASNCANEQTIERTNMLALFRYIYDFWRVGVKMKHFTFRNQFNIRTRFPLINQQNTIFSVIRSKIVTAKK